MKRFFIVGAIAVASACGADLVDPDTTPDTNATGTGIANTWVGTGGSVAPGAITSTAQITWRFEAYAAGVATYRPSGTASASVAGCTVTPNSGTVTPTGGVLIVDYNTNPPSYSGSGLTQWSATWACPPQQPFVADVVAGYFAAASGQVTGGGTTIQGSADAGGTTFSWNLTRQGTR